MPGPTDTHTLSQAAVAASIDRADNAHFLERFRYTIVASQLLSPHPMPGLRSNPPNRNEEKMLGRTKSILSAESILASMLGALALAIILSWISGHAARRFTRNRTLFLLLLVVAAAFLAQVYMRRQWLRYRRDQSLSEMATFVSLSHHFDAAVEASLALIQEVELVSRGYRMFVLSPSSPRLRLRRRPFQTDTLLSRP